MGQKQSCLMCLQRKRAASTSESSPTPDTTMNAKDSTSTSKKTAENAESNEPLVIDNYNHRFFWNETPSKKMTDTDKTLKTEIPEFEIRNGTLILNQSKEDARWAINPLTSKLLLRSARPKLLHAADSPKHEPEMTNGQEYHHELPYIPQRPNFNFLQNNLTKKSDDDWQPDLEEICKSITSPPKADVPHIPPLRHELSLNSYVDESASDVDKMRSTNPPAVPPRLFENDKKVPHDQLNTNGELPSLESRKQFN